MKNSSSSCSPAMNSGVPRCHRSYNPQHEMIFAYMTVFPHYMVSPTVQVAMLPCTRVKQPKQDKTDVTIHLVIRFPKFHEDYYYLSILSSVLITVYTVYTQTLLGGSQHKIFNYITINCQLSIINYQLSAINYDYYPSRGSQHKIFYYIIINEVLYYYQ